MRALIALALVGTLAACAAVPTTPLEAQPQRRQLSGFATLAPADSFEWRAAPAITRLAQLRYRAARALDRGKIGADQARSIQIRADTVRILLDSGAAADKRGDAPAATAALGDALAHLDRAERYLRAAASGKT